MFVQINKPLDTGSQCANFYFHTLRGKVHQSPKLDKIMDSESSEIKDKKLRSKGWSENDSVLLIKAWVHIEAIKKGTFDL